MFAGQVATRADAMRQTIDVVRDTMKDFAANGATEKELDDAKTYITGSFPLAFASNVGIVNQLNSFQRVGLPIDYIQKRNALINAVTLDDVKRVAGRLFTQQAHHRDRRQSAGSAGCSPADGGSRKASSAGAAAAQAHAAHDRTPGPKPPVASTTAAKPKEQPKAPAATPGAGTQPHP